MSNQKGDQMEYVMKDLGYTRTPTSALYRVTMEDGSQWDVPVQAIADSRDEHYREEEEDTIGFIRSRSLAGFEINDWAGNNMNWEDVSDYAFRAEVEPKKIDWQEGWTNGEKKIVGEL